MPVVALARFRAFSSIVAMRMASREIRRARCKPRTENWPPKKRRRKRPSPRSCSRAASEDGVGLTRYIGRYNFCVVRYIASYIRDADWRFAGALRVVREG